MIIAITNTLSLNTDNIAAIQRNDKTVTIFTTDGNDYPINFPTAAAAASAYLVFSNLAGSGSNVPSITKIYPTTGPAAGGTVCVVAGFNFNPVFTADIGGAGATHADVTPYAFYIISPANPAGTYDVNYLGVDGQAAALLNGFTYT